MNNTTILEYLEKAANLKLGETREFMRVLAVKMLLIRLLLEKFTPNFEYDLDFNLSDGNECERLLKTPSDELPIAVNEILRSDDTFQRTDCIKMMKVGDLAYRVDTYNFAPQDFSLLIDAINDSRTSALMNYHLGYNSLITGLAEISQNTSVYATAPASLSVMGDIVQLAKEVCYESLGYSYLSQAFEALFGDKVTIQYNDIYINPAFIKNNQLQKFDIGLAIPPFGVKLSFDEIAKTDKFNRFVIHSRSSEVVTIQHLMAHTTGIVVVAVTMGVLFTLIEKGFRKYLVEKGLLKSIVFLPQNSMSGTSIPSALLVIDMQGGHNSVRFTDVDLAGFTRKERRAITLVNVDELLAKIHSPENFKGIVTISTDEIAEKDFDLTNGRYALSESDQKFEQFLVGQQTMPLVKIVNFERALPLSIKNQDEGAEVKVLEITNADMADDYLLPPTKSISVSSRILDEYEDSFLQPKDILIISKGANSGKVVFVPDTAPEAGENGWVAGQFATVLRMKKNAPMTAESLFVFLRSAIGQRLLSQFSVGTAIANLPLSNLKNLEIFLPNEEQQRQAADIVAQDIQSEQQIQQIKEQRIQRFQSLWYV